MKYVIQVYQNIMTFLLKRLLQMYERYKNVIGCKDIYETFESI